MLDHVPEADGIKNPDPVRQVLDTARPQPVRNVGVALPRDIDRGRGDIQAGHPEPGFCKLEKIPRGASGVEDCGILRQELPQQVEAPLILPPRCRFTPVSGVLDMQSPVDARKHCGIRLVAYLHELTAPAALYRIALDDEQRCEIIAPAQSTGTQVLAAC